jgi:uncharacterized protein YaiI (UPF0178 family)
MKIYIDADAFPNVIKDILIRASERLNVPLVFVANKPPRFKTSAHISVVLVEEGADVADDRITSLAQACDLIITSDIPLADRVIAKGAFALTPRGDLFTEENVKDRLSTRDLLSKLRDNGMITGGPAAFSKNDRQAFANSLDSLLIKQLKAENTRK